MPDIDRLRLELELAREKRLLAEIQLKTMEARGEKRKRSKKDKGKEWVGVFEIWALEDRRLHEQRSLITKKRCFPLRHLATLVQPINFLLP